MSNSHDLKGLFKFLNRDEWPHCFAMVFDDHLGQTLKAGEMKFEDLAGMIGNEWANTLWGCAFEDFLTQEFDVAGVNMIDDYMKRRGWKESARTKAYIRALRTSTMSLYRVEQVVPGQSLSLRDVIRGGDDVVVSDPGMARSVKVGDHLAARVVEELNRLILAGGALLFSDEAVATLLDSLREAYGKAADEPLPQPTEQELRSVAALFTLSWLTHELGDRLPQGKAAAEAADSGAVEGSEVNEAVAVDANGTEPSTANTTVSVMEETTGSSDAELAPHEVRFPLAAKVLQKDLTPHLDEADWLQKHSAKVWHWHHEGQILGAAELKGRHLTLSVESAARAKWGAEVFSWKLSELLREPEIEAVMVP